MKKIIVNCETGEVLEEDFSEKELMERDLLAKRISEENSANEQVKNEALEKLKMLGLDNSDLKALGLA